jgi:alkylhydroperoxidase/carboxymuconolactone decarboxylase family protein YurZ
MPRQLMTQELEVLAAPQVQGTTSCLLYHMQKAADTEASYKQD